MTKSHLNELKEFFTSTLAVTIKKEVGELRDEMNRRFDENDEKQNEILNAIGYRFNDHDVALMRHSTDILNHENRILRLENNWLITA